MTNSSEALHLVLLESMDKNGDEIRRDDRPLTARKTAMSAIDPQQFGQLQAQVQQLIESDREKTDLLRELNAHVTAMRLQMAEATGGWKALVGIAGASATLGGIAMWALTHLAAWFGKGS